MIHIFILYILIYLVIVYIIKIFIFSNTIDKIKMNYISVILTPIKNIIKKFILHFDFIFFVLFIIRNV